MYQYDVISAYELCLITRIYLVTYLLVYQYNDEWRKNDNLTRKIRY